MEENLLTTEKKSEVKKFFEKIPSLLFRNGVWVAITLYIILAAVICCTVTDIASTKWFLWFVWLITAISIGSLCSFFYKKFEDAESIDFSEPTTNNVYHKELSFKCLKWMKNHTEYPLWEILHWIAVFGFLGLTFVIMAMGMQSLFTDDEIGTKVLVWTFSFLVTFTLFWLVIMISRRGKKWQWFLVFYIVFDLLSAFTFNYFHFYDNVSKTQRMENSIKYSRELVEMIGTPIAEEVARLDSIGNSEQVQKLKQDQTRLNAELENISKERQNPTLKETEIRWYNEDGRELSRKDNVRVKSDKQLEKEDKAADDKLKKVNEQLKTYYSGSGNSMSIILHEEDSLCKEVQRKIRNFENETIKKQKPILRDSVVNDISNLGGKLRKTQLSGISQEEIKEKIDVIKLPEVTRLESVKSLFDALGRVFSSETQEKEDSEDRLVFMSITLSMLIDLLPMLLGLFVAISTNRRNIQ
jgi:hypothetical protein